MGDISLRIKELIDDNELSNGEFAKAIGVNPSIISHILSGRNKVSLQVVEAVKSHFTNVNLDYLLSGEGRLYNEITNVKSNEDLPLSSPGPASGFPMEGVRHAAIPGSVPAYTQNEQEGEEENISKEEPLPTSVKRSSDDSIKPSSPTHGEIEQVIIFYKDGSFKVYRPGSS